MRRLGKRTLCMAWLLVLLVSSVSSFGWAKQEERFVNEVSAWSEGAAVIMQVELDKTYDQVELVFSQAGEGEALAYSDAAHLSAKVEAMSNSPVYVQIRVYDSKKLSATALYRFTPVEKSAEEKLSVQKGAGKRSKSKGQKPLDVHLLMKSNAADPTKLRRQEEAYAKTIHTGTKPRESAAKSVPATFEVEPNDKQEKADWLFAGKDAYGKIAKNGDTDYWKIKAAQEGTFTFWLGEIPSGQNYEVAVYDSQGLELGRSEKNGSMDELIEGIATEKNEWYYVVVRGGSGSFDSKRYYHLKAEFLARGMDVKPDLFEPNNQISNASPIHDGMEFEGNIHDLADADYYSFEVPLASTIGVKLSNIPQGMDLDLYLYDPKQKLAAKSEKAKHANESIQFNGDPGRYYVKIAAGRTSALVNHDYKLEVQVHTIPVILIPGIGGSRLLAQEGGKVSEAWLGAEDMLWELTEAKHRRLLSLRPKQAGSIQVVPREEGIEVFPEADEFRAVEYLTYSPMPLVKERAEQYHSMIQHVQTMGYRKGESLFAFPYDWRLSNADQAVRLKQKIDAVLRQSKANQVQLVAHSMGGLLVKETLLSSPSYQAKVKRAVYLGTPFLGAPRAYQAIKLGYNFSIPILKEETGQIIAQYAPAVYELLPSKEYVKRESYVQLADQHGTRPLSYEQMQKDKRIRLDYEPLVRMSGQLHSKWDTKTLAVPQYVIVGQGQATLAGYRYDANYHVFTPYFDQAQGDGTVPFTSANYSQKDIKKKYYVNEEHAGLLRNPFVIQQVAHLLIGIEDVQSGLSPTPRKSHRYLTYMIRSEDGRLPDVTITHNDRITRLADGSGGDDGLRVEYHGSIIVVHVVDHKEIRLSHSGRMAHKNGSAIIVQRFSSDLKGRAQQEGTSYRLHGLELLEVTKP